jgi:hypothetical protein
VADAPLSDDDGRRLAKGVGPARGDVARVTSLTPLPRKTARRLGLPLVAEELREPGEVGELGEVISINKGKKKVSLLQTTDENKVTKVTNLTSSFHRESTLIGSANATQTDYRHIP